MDRSKKIVLISHCIINQNSVVKPYAREFKDFKNLILTLIENNIGIIQLPCPEISMYGLKRWGHVKDQFETPNFKKTSKKLLENTLESVEEYKNNGYEILGVIGIKGSPSCGVTKTCRGKWEGSIGDEKNIENARRTLREVDEPGVFMEVLDSSIKELGFELKFYDDIDLLEKIIKNK